MGDGKTFCNPKGRITGTGDAGLQSTDSAPCINVANKLPVSSTRKSQFSSTNLSAAVYKRYKTLAQLEGIVT